MKTYTLAELLFKHRELAEKTPDGVKYTFSSVRAAIAGEI